MKCPKCGYLGFERVERCRHCGYDFSLAAPADSFELPLKPVSGEPEGRQTLDDLSFLDRAMAAGSAGALGEEPEARGAGPNRAPAPPPRPAAPEPRPRTAGELPLFGSPGPDDLPLITRPSPPRQPLAVRRATPEVPRLRSSSARLSTLDLGFEAAEAEPAPGVTGFDAVPARGAGGTEDATIGSRCAAVLLDLAILAGVDVAVVYFTMQICGVGLGELGLLPRAPLFAFLIVQNGGYLVALTAGGQTLGKMAAGIKVVSAESLASLDLGRAFVRELAWLVLAAPAGLGFLTALNRDRRGFHDRFAGTRVIRASL
jgi:uncharacterized RDD family membrane protein YckC